MCLDSGWQIKGPEDVEELECWKIMRKWDEDRYLSSMRGKFHVYRVGEWEKSSDEWIESLVSEKICYYSYQDCSYTVVKPVEVPIQAVGASSYELYRSGFHAYLSLEDARYSYNVSGWSPPNVIMRVRLRRLTAIGREGERVVAVGQEMKILGEA